MARHRRAVQTDGICRTGLPVEATRPIWELQEGLYDSGALAHVVDTAVGGLAIHKVLLETYGHIDVAFALRDARTPIEVFDALRVLDAKRYTNERGISDSARKENIHVAMGALCENTSSSPRHPEFLEELDNILRDNATIGLARRMNSIALVYGSGIPDELALACTLHHRRLHIALGRKYIMPSEFNEYRSHLEEFENLAAKKLPLQSRSSWTTEEL